MSKSTINSKVASHVKAFLRNEKDHHNGKSYVIGNTHIQKGNDGIISVYLNDDRILVIETGQDGHDGFRPISAMAVKRLNAIKQELLLEFDLVWLKGHAYALDSNGNNVPLSGYEHSINELSRITYS